MSVVTVVIHALHYSLGKKPVCRLYHDLVKSLTLAGFKVVVITARNGQSVSSQYGEVLITVNNIGNLGESKASRILDYWSFFYYSFRISRRLVSKSSHLNLVKSGYGISALVSMFFRKMYNENIIFWVLDRYPDILFNPTGRRSILFRVLKTFQIYALNQFNRVIFESQNDMMDYINHQGSTSSGIVNTWSEDITRIHTYVKPAWWDNYQLGSKTIATYSGNIANSFDCSKLEALVAENPNIFFLIIGSGIQYETLKNSKYYQKADNILISPQLDFPEYYYALSNSSYGLIILKDGIDVFSSKLTTYLAFNKPIIAAVDENNVMCHLIKKRNIGLIISDKQKKIDYSQNNYNRMIANVEIVKKEYSMDYNTKRFIEYLKNEM